MGCKALNPLVSFLWVTESEVPTSLSFPVGIAAPLLSPTLISEQGVQLLLGRADSLTQLTLP